MSQLDDIYATVLRQAYFIRFEQTAHRMVAEGATGTNWPKLIWLNFGSNSARP